MTTRKFVRRVMLTAAVSTASVTYTVDSDLFGFETAAKTPSSGIQQTQNQPGPTGGQPNSAVTQELNRMFQESGQPMPSMNPAELPNAQGQHANMVRPKPQTKTQQPAKKNFLQKFIGKITGQEQKTAEAKVVPPVPPNYKPSAPVANPTSGPRQMTQSQPVVAQPASTSQSRPQASASQAGVKPNGSNTQSTSQPRANNNAVQPGTRQANAAPLRTAQTSQPGTQVRRTSQPSRPVPPVPGTHQPGTATSVPRPVERGTQQYVQPGTAPAFMPSSQVALSDGRSPVQSKVPAKASPSSEPLAAPPADDAFEDPFNDSALGADAAEEMDLDSLIEVPKSESTAAVPPGGVAKSSGSAPVNAEETAAVGDQSPVTPAGAEPVAAEEELNPFTGVRLNETDAEMFDPELTESASDATGSASSTAVQSAENTEAFGAPVPPMEDFGTNLPAINLPAVDEIPTERTSPAVRAAELGVKAADAAVTNSPAIPPGSDRKPDSNSAAASESHAAAPVDVTESAAGPLRSVDAERLQQAAEQDRRMRQQRLILSRANQTGFKGFCPVELRDRRDLVDANPEFTAAFGLQTYSFSSAESRTAFEADPSRYAPAAGGSDVVLLVNNGEEQPGVLDYALWYRDRLYLFRSRETMSLFNKDPLRFANQY